MKKLLTAILCFLFFTCTAQRNVVLIIADDLGTDYCGFYENHGDTASLPNLRKLLSKGVRFTNAMSNPLCSPTRAGIFTGQYSFRTTVGTSIGLNNPDNALDTSEICIPKLLNTYAPNAIAKGHFGKWHLNLDTPATNLLIPNLMGYDYYSGNFRALVYDYYNWKKNTNGVLKTIKTYATTETVNNAISWLKVQQKPVFLWLAFNAPHEPWHLPPAGMYTDTTLTGTTQHINQNPKKYYKAALEALDHEVGRLFDSLKVINKYDSTDFIFIGDNGNPREICQDPLDSLKSKGTVYQGGVNVPMIISGPSVVNGGRMSDALVNTQDLFATILELFGDTTWQNNIPINKPVDSKSLMPIIKNSASYTRDWAYSEIFSQSNLTFGARAIRSNNYKYLRTNNGKNELYNLTTDPKEYVNLINTQLSDSDKINYLDLCNKLATLTGGTFSCDALLEVEPEITAVKCFGDSTGNILLNVTGAEPPYTYLWNDGVTTKLRSKLVAGNYTVSVFDEYGQEKQLTINIVQPLPLLVTGSFNVSACGGDVNLAVEGGTTPYLYNWSNGRTNSSLSNVIPGTYIITVTDTNRCSAADTIAVINTSILKAPSTQKVVFCFDNINPSATAHPVGGFSQYSYLWSNGQTNQTATALATGLFSVTITDSAGCIAKTTVTLTSNKQLVLKTSFNNASCNANSGSIVVGTTGGKSPYSYIWNNGVTTASISNLAPGFYSILVTDILGCTKSAPFTIGRTGTPPIKPLAISGPLNVACGDTTIATYSIALVSKANSYIWTAPANSTIVSGQGTNTITINYMPSFISGNIEVRAENFCGIGDVRTALIVTNPPIPGSITGPVTVCANQTNVSYAIAPVIGATSYLWTKPAGATFISGQGTTAVVIKFKTTADYIRVQAINPCGASLIKSLQLTMNCREQKESFISDLNFYPNPTNDFLNISFNSGLDAVFTVTISNVIGQAVFSETQKATIAYNQTAIDLSKLTGGIYFLTFEMNGEKKVMKVAVN